jgi:hypothetical protein
MALRLCLALACLLAPRLVAGQPPTPPDAIEKLVARLEQAIGSGDRAAILAMIDPDGDSASVEAFADAASEKPTRVVIKERDRQALVGGSQRLLIEVFIERGIEGNFSTWRVDLRKTTGRTEWLIEKMEGLPPVSGLFRLSLNAGKQFDVRNLVLTGTDLTIEMPTGTAFVAETPDGPTAIVLLGRGRMKFAPPDAAERTQIRIFTGADELVSEFDGAFIRIRPSEFSSRFGADAFVAREVSQGDFRRASEIYEEYIGRTLQIDLTDLSRDRWSLTPSSGDLIAEVRTRRFGSLTYARSGNEAEDVTVFDRRKRRNISLYGSATKVAERGRFYSEDELVDYDVLAYEIDTTFAPDRLWINGTTHMKVRIRAAAATTLTLKLAEALTVRGVYADGIGRLLHLRVVNQNSLIVNLPAPLFRDNELTLTIVYSGRLEPQDFDREAIDLQERQEREVTTIPLEPRFIYSNNSFWYPQAAVSDYALSTLRITVPQDLDVVASGKLVGPPTPATGQGSRGLRTFVFENDRPVRYLSCVISRLTPVTSTRLNNIRSSTGSFGDLRIARTDGPTSGADGPARPGSAADALKIGSAEAADEDRGLSLIVKANPRQAGRARAMADQTATILQFYASIVGEAPYPTFTLAVTENEVPGGHSPAYFAVLHQVLPTAPVRWQNDPVNFENYPSFFLAHELAHQWWGQAVGWKNYHEQWLSEGFAQYFAALYAEKDLGPNVFSAVLRQMRRSALDTAAQGPVYLGYRLGHIKGERQVFRALVYNKAAMVLHMLRRLVGDDPFFFSLRRFYAEWRFRKAGSDDYRASIEATAGRDLGPFFEAWIYGASIPRVAFSYRTTDPNKVVVRFEHRGEVMPVPITVTLTYASGETEDVVVPVTDKVAERTIQLKGALRKVEANEDNGALVEIEK